MWSHYADNHTGLVLELETNEAPFSAIPNHILTVKYSEKKPDYIYSHEFGAFTKNMFPVIAAKAIDWAYEKEVRKFFCLKTPSEMACACLFHLYA